MPRVKKSQVARRTKGSRIAALKRKLETPEERASRLEKGRNYSAAKRASETFEERQYRLEQQRERANTVRQNLRKAAKQADLNEVFSRIDAVLLSEPNADISTYFSRKQISAYKAFVRLKMQKEIAVKKASERRQKETPEQRATRLEKLRVRAAEKRANESFQERESRLTKQRERLRAVRAHLKMKNKQNSQEFVSQRSLKYWEHMMHNQKTHTKQYRTRAPDMQTCAIGEDTPAVFDGKKLQKTFRQVLFKQNDGFIIEGPICSSNVSDSLHKISRQHLAQQYFLWQNHLAEEKSNNLAPCNDECTSWIRAPPNDLEMTSVPVECDVVIEEGSESVNSNSVILDRFHD